MSSRGSQMLRAVARWLDSEAGSTPTEQLLRKRWTGFESFPLLSCMSPVWDHLGRWSWAALAVPQACTWFACSLSRPFTTATSPQGLQGRPVLAILFALLGNASANGPSVVGRPSQAPHRTRTRKRMSIPGQHGFWWSHMIWLTTQANFPTRKNMCRTGRSS